MLSIASKTVTFEERAVDLVDDDAGLDTLGQRLTPKLGRDHR